MYLLRKGIHFFKSNKKSYFVLFIWQPCFCYKLHVAHLNGDFFNKNAFVEVKQIIQKLTKNINLQNEHTRKRKQKTEDDATKIESKLRL